MKLDIKKVIGIFRKNIFVQAGVCAIFLLLFVLFFLLPAHSRTKKIAYEVDQIYASNQETQSVILSSGHSGQKLQHIQKLLAKYQRMIRPRSELSEVLDKIASRAQEHGLEVLSLKPLRNTPYPQTPEGLLDNPNEQVYEVVIAMKAKGLFMEVGGYVNDLEGAPYKIIIKNLDLKIPGFADKATVEPELSVEMILSVLMRFSSEESAL